MRRYGIPDKLVRVIEDIFARFECAVVDGNLKSDWFMIKLGVKQGCVMSRFLFLLCLDWVKRKATASKRRGIRWNFTTVLEDLDFADKISLLSSKFNNLHEKTGRLVEEAARVRTKNLMPESVRHYGQSVLVTGRRFWWMAKNWMTLRSLHPWELY